MRIYLLSLLILLFGLIPFSSLAVEYPQIDNINDYYGEEPYVFETSSSSWFVLNNEKKYEKWGIVEQAEYLDALTTYNGKYALVGGAIYRFDNGWHSTSITVNSFSRPSNGVYIIDKCGKAIKTTDFSPANNSSVIAVALITDKMAAMISKKNVLGNENVWNSSGENIPVIWGESGLVNGVMQTAANGSNAIPGAVVNDFAGYNNTRLINQALNNPENSAVMMASQYAFENGIHGYLPAFGELGEVKNNLSDINNALALIGGKPLDGLYWTSSQHYLNYRAWWIQLGTGHDNNQHFAALRNNHTPLSATYYNACYALLRPFGKLPDFTFDNPYPETPFHTSLLGDVNNDGYLDIDDVSTLIDYLLTRDESKLDLRNADCEIDGIINIEDVTALIDFILHRSWPWETKTFKVNGVSFKMIKVQGGTFMMGASTEQATDAESDERPLHQVTLSTYGIGQTEVTQELWLAVMGNNPSYHKGDLNLPVEYISWNDCQEFIERLNSLTGENFRLPTEAEWEFAARGGQKSNGFKYSGSDNISDVAWHNGNASGKTHKVAIKKANELGIYDMSGNVSEWCQDWYGNYTNDAQIDPSGSSSGTRRVNRGGSWYDGQNLCRVTNREAWNPSTGAPFGTLGLRLAIDIEEEKPLMLSINDVTLVVGSQCDIDILNGSGNYSVSCNDSIVTANINDSRLVVTGNHIGSTTIYVCDNYSNSKVALTVTVISSEVSIETFTVNGVSFKMVSVDGGTFTMGATEEQGTDYANHELPTHQVSLSSFYIGQTEVTQALWKAVMGNNPSSFGDDLNRPVADVSWNSCQTFITRLNEITGMQFRLPTEAEWEFAARGGIKSLGYKYAGSDNIDEVAWYKNNGSSTTHPVASKSPNELGLYDMSGNVWEWCQDWYGGYTSSDQINPIGPNTGSSRIHRGGSTNSPASDCRVSTRDEYWPSSPNIYLGLRLALNKDENSVFCLSDSEITLQIGEKKCIQILNGKGDYSIICSDSIATAIINNSQLEITGNHIGNTTIIIIDNTTNSEVMLSVTVIDSMLQNETFNVNGVSFTMIAVEGGTFIMGATSEQGTSEAWSSEYPTHQVTVDDFKIGETQVTQALWVAVMGSNPSRFTGNSSRPVDQVTWNECMQFISKLNEITGRNFRLPTEGEWEFAARGGNQSNGYKYAGSNDIGTVAWYSGNANSTTHPVSQKLPNELGLFDMSGNLYDWCSDWYGDYNEVSQINPKGPSTGTAKVSRGGCWYGNARYCRVSHRRGVEMTSGKRSDQGLRLAL